MKYGISYQGSKSRIAEKIISILPAGGCLVDLFAGGGAITHCAILSGKWKRVLANDISGSLDLFAKAARGELEEDFGWVDREAFEREKDSNALIRLLWSFGNGGENYLYSREIEAYKRAVHDCLTGGTLRERRRAFRVVIRELFKYLRTESGGVIRLGLIDYACGKRCEALSFPCKKSDDSEALINCVERFGGLQNIERLERVESLEMFDRLKKAKILNGVDILETMRRDYRSVPIPEGAIVYCDPPYHGTKGYSESGAFDIEAFYEWVKAQRAPVYFSEYAAPEDFECVWSFRIPKTFSHYSKFGKYSNEKLFANEAGKALLYEMRADLFS